MSTLDLFLSLVKIASPSGQEQAVRDYIQNFLSGHGITSQVDATGNLFASIEGQGEPVILSAHLDTVEPATGINPQISNGFVISDGSTILGADDKVAVASFLQAITEVPASSRKAVELILSVREETDGGINTFDFSLLKSKVGLIADRSAPIGTIVLSSPWIENLTIQVLGKPAHAGLPEQGINALSAASNAISSLKWGRLDEHTTANIGLISGGTAMNTVPHHVQLIGEVRSFSKSSLDNHLATIRNTFHSLQSSNRVNVSFTATSYCPGYVYTPKDPGVQAVQYALSSRGLTPEYQVSFGGSDANTFAIHNIQVVNIGDGTSNPHTAKETVSLDSLNLLTEVAKAYITL